jgi:hypothetical protein
LAQLIRIAALERALRDAIAELDQDESLFRVVPRLKVERDALRRDVGSDTDWLSESSFDRDDGPTTFH